MNGTSLIALFICLVLLGVVAVGGVAAVSQDTTVGDLQSESSVVDTDDDSVEIDQALRDATGEVEVIVSLPDVDRTLSPSRLQAHASETQQPLLRFAEAGSGVTVENTFWLTNAALVTVDTSMVSLSDLAAVEGVQAIHENAEVRINTGSTAGTPAVQSPGTDASNYTYGLEQINAPTAWNTHNTTGAGASVAVLDTGVDADHPDLNVTKWQEFDGNGNPEDTQPNDGDGHGTHVSGTVSGAMSPDGDVPVYGVAPGVDLYGVKVLEDDGFGTLAQIIAGMEWAVQEDADIISMSLGAPGYFDQLIDPVQNAHDAGTVVIASSGNSGEGSSGSPGNVYDSIAVGMSNEGLGIDSDSSGEVVDTQSWDSPPPDWPDEYTVPSIAAPGVEVLSSVPGGGYDDTYSGTSMAAPHVSGAVALAESATNDSLTPQAIEEALEETAFKPDGASAPPGERDTRYGSGIIDADALVNYLQAEFAVSVVSANAPVVGGEQLDVTATIENTGDTEATQKITLSVGDLGGNSTSVTLGGGNSTNVTLSVGTSAGDAGEYNATVSSPDDSASMNVTVHEQSSFDVTMTSVDSAVTTGETVTITYEVTNAGDVADTQNITFSINGTDEGTESGLTLNGSETFSGQFSYDTADEDTPAVSVTVSSEDDTATADVTVLTAPNFVVSELTAPAEATIGASINFSATIGNTGDKSGTQRFNLTVNGTPVDTTTVSLDGGNATTVRLTWETGAGDDGNSTLRLSGDDDTETTEVRVNPLTVADYTNDNGIVTTFGLFNAVDDWRQNLIESPLLLDVVAAWRSDQPVYPPTWSVQVTLA